MIPGISTGLIHHFLNKVWSITGKNTIGQVSTDFKQAHQVFIQWLKNVMAFKSKYHLVRKLRKFQRPFVVFQE
jgi:hypothetical protein